MHPCLFFLRHLLFSVQLLYIRCCSSARRLTCRTCGRRSASRSGSARPAALPISSRRSATRKSAFLSSAESCFTSSFFICKTNCYRRFLSDIRGCTSSPSRSTCGRRSLRQPKTEASRSRPSVRCVRIRHWSWRGPSLLST